MLSLDCEGLWGMADNRPIMQATLINAASLADAYDFIAETLDRSGVRATAAFVSAFAAPMEALFEILPQFEEIAARQPGWFEHLLPRVRSRNPADLNGLIGHPYWRQIAAGGHEMAWHGATHLPFEPGLAPDVVDLEIALARGLEPGGRLPATMIFPRNIVGHLPALHATGIRRYRQGNGQGLLRRAASFAGEWFPSARADDRAIWREGLLSVTAPGHFLNWPSGARAGVPATLTLRRWRSMLNNAAASGRTVHMWFHPHNLITAPRMRETFAAIMTEVGQLVRCGALESLTIADLEKHLSPEPV